MICHKTPTNIFNSVHIYLSIYLNLFPVEACLMFFHVLFLYWCDHCMLPNYLYPIFSSYFFFLIISSSTSVFSLLDVIVLFFFFPTFFFFFLDPFFFIFFIVYTCLVADMCSSSCSSSLTSDTPQLISVMKSHTSPALHIYNSVGMSTGLDLPSCDCNGHLSSRLSSSSSSSSKCRLSGPSTSGSKHYHYKKHHRRASSGDKWKIQVSQELKAEIEKLSRKGWLYLFI